MDNLFGGRKPNHRILLVDGLKLFSFDRRHIFQQKCRMDQGQSSIQGALCEAKVFDMAVLFFGHGMAGATIFFGSDPKPGTRIFTLLVPTFAWLILVLGYTCVAYHRVCKKIPLPTKRSANFERRALRDFVPPFWTILCYLLYAVAIGVYIVAIRTELIPMQVFVGRMIGFVIILVTGTSTLLYCLRRKKQAIDDAWGPFYRKMEVTGNIILLYGCLLVVAWGMLRDFFSVSLFGEAAYFFAMLNVLMQLAWVTFMTRPAVKRLLASGQ